MQLKPEFVLSYAPSLSAQCVAEKEAVLIRSIAANLTSMRVECNRLSTDVALFEFCEANGDKVFREWTFLAARDGAMALRNFSEALAAVRGLVGRFAQH